MAKYWADSTNKWSNELILAGCAIVDGIGVTLRVVIWRTFGRFGWRICKIVNGRCCRIRALMAEDRTKSIVHGSQQDIATNCSASAERFII
jgi:hypothetical protein